MTPHIDTVGSEWHLEVSRQRAAANWLAKGSAGGPGQTAQSMCCGMMDGAYENPHICPNETAGRGGYPGFEMTTHIGPFPGLYYFSDLSLRFVAAMSVAPLIEYYDYTLDGDFLARKAYPLVKGVADFWVAYATPDATNASIFHIENSCAQEICGGGPPGGETDPHHDLAFARLTLGAALRYSAILDVDKESRPAWSTLLAGLAPYPEGTYKGQSVWLEAANTEKYFLSNAGGYSIVYYAALHPANVVGLSSPESVLATAWNTVNSVNAVGNPWAPMNGLCMAWPPATRCAGPGRAASVLDAWEGALQRTMRPNFWPDLGGGGIEQAGATEGVNGALVQSAEGFVRFFPMWPPTGESSSFRNLRVRGAFLLSAAWSGDLGAVLGSIYVTALGPAAARPFTFIKFWAGNTSASATPPVATATKSPPICSPLACEPAPLVCADCWTFLAQPGGTYQLSAPPTDV